MSGDYPDNDARITEAEKQAEIRATGDTVARHPGDRAIHIGGRKVAIGNDTWANGRYSCPYETPAIQINGKIPKTEEIGR